MKDGDSVKRGEVHPVAVVDDDQDMCLMLRGLLDRSGSFVCSGSYFTGSDALIGIPGATVEVVLLDQRLPDASGLECLDILKARLPDLKVILMTAVADDSVVEEALLRRVDAILIKPFLPAQCFAMLKSVLRSGMGSQDGFSADPLKLRMGMRPLESPKSECPRLSEREAKVLEAAAAGLYYKEIAATTGWSHSAVHNLLHKAYQKLGAANRTEALNNWAKYRKESSVSPPGSG